ncbi:MAG: hypothetical protein QXH51_03155 [Candidatus Bathyarchaeia archaeon]
MSEMVIKTLDDLLRDPEYGNIYREILKFCREPKTKDEIERFVLENLQATYEKTKVWPAYFIWELEKTGGLRWEGKWKTTEMGLKIIS